MKIEENISLREYTTFKIGGPARYFARVDSPEDLSEIVNFAKEKNLKIFILGGGSNIVVSDKGFDGLVIHPTMKGTEIISEDDKKVVLKLGAGENWDEAVAYAVEQGWWGIENLSHIPGNSAAVVVQNVGAYGEEVSSVFKSVEVFDIETLKVKNLTRAECKFTYRHSIFNATHKNRFIILSVTLELSKKPNPILTYSDVKKYFEENSSVEPTLREIRKAIIAIRDRKFPFPRTAVNGSAGSFFRGPIITKGKLEEIKEKIKNEFGDDSASRIPKMKDSLQVLQGYKTPTAFLIEHAGLRGFQIGGAKVHDIQPAIVLNATGTASSEDIMNLAEHVRATVKDKFGVELEIEPELIGF
jgi:UDP-N-acetylmuramate dehydrogenase